MKNVQIKVTSLIALLVLLFGLQACDSLVTPGAPDLIGTVQTENGGDNGGGDNPPPPPPPPPEGGQS